MVQYMESFGLFLSFALNFCLIFDLLIMMRFPFSDKNKYMTKYQLFSVISSLAVSVFFVYEANVEDSSTFIDWVI